MNSPKNGNFQGLHISFNIVTLGIIKFLSSNTGGAGKARFNVATPTNATVACTAYVLPYNFQTKSI